MDISMCDNVLMRTTGRLSEQLWSAGARSEGNRWTLQLTLELTDEEGDALFAATREVGPSTSPVWECGDDEQEEFV